MRKIKVLHIITGLNAGGAEKVVYDLCMHLDRNRFSSFVVVMSEKEMLLPLFLDSGIPTVTLRMRRNLFSFFRGLGKIHKLIQAEKIDLMHAHMYHAMISGVFLKLFYGRLPLVFTPHNVKMGSLLRDMTSFMLRFLRNVDILFSSSHKRYFLKNHNRIIPNGIAVKETSDSPKFDKFTFLMVGRLDPVKNHLAILPVIQKLSKEFDFQLLIAGTGFLQDKINTKIKDLQLEHTVKILGFRTDVQELCARSHVFLMPSLWEGFPLAILEAGLAKLPVISTPVGCIPDLIDEKTGYLAVTDRFEQWMSHTIKNYDEAKIRGERLHRKIKNQFNMEKVASMHEALYEQVLAKKHTNPELQ